jgi:hypothetical protein
MTIPCATYLEEINKRVGQYFVSFTGMEILNQVLYRLSTATKTYIQAREKELRFALWEDMFPTNYNPPRKNAENLIHSFRTVEP